jgi:hypothetical protein
MYITEEEGYDVAQAKYVELLSEVDASLSYKEIVNELGLFNPFVEETYIKLKIEMPAYKYIDDIAIFAEYTSTNSDPLRLIAKQNGYIESKIYDLQEVTNCFVKSIDVNEIGNINDVNIYVRSSKDNERLDIWNSWREIKLNKELNITNKVEFINARFLQFKIVLKNRKAFINLKGINIEIK